MILKVKTSSGAWVFFDKIERVMVHFGYSYIEYPESDTNSIRQRFTELFLNERLVGNSSTPLPETYRGVFVAATRFGIEPTVLDIFFDTEAYLLADTGKTIEKL